MRICFILGLKQEFLIILLMIRAFLGEKDLMLIISLKGLR